MKWREVKSEAYIKKYLWHYSSSHEHNCVVAALVDNVYIYQLSSKYYPKDYFLDYPQDKIQKEITKGFFETKQYQRLIAYIFTNL